MVIGPVQEDNRYILYKVVAIDQQASKPYEIAIIEKQLVPGDQTRDLLFRKADYCASTVKSAAQLATYVAQAQEALQIQEAQVGKNDVQVGRLAQARELVRWLYNDTTVDQVSPVFELDSEYVVAVMTKHVPSGTAPLAQVRNEIALKVSNQHKASAIMAKLQQCSNETLEAKAAQYGSAAQLLEEKLLHFEDDTLPNAGMARNAVGTAFALAPGAQATVADDNGVLVLEVVTQGKVEAPEDINAYQQDLKQFAKVRQPYEILQALEALTPTKDSRYKFY